MESLNEILTNWYPVFFILSAVIALTVWAWASKKKARLDIDKANKLILKRRYRNGEISKKEYETRIGDT
ncbi:hypothetical protein DYD21_03315 [Rhodohalobacter sp. SW132]|uniref:hypothetical protein n=1 Tax=Rhodohalobacter sp. SW132 TaxID=2293433 RepID=UPI000E26EE72|nr:hypothetical protein [Rhodohalobacter sp. SW132]REL38998.1 hypothetical protein DYD21_03315 [Rhodohalobacter sp. SW132]